MTTGTKTMDDISKLPETTGKWKIATVNHDLIGCEYIKSDNDLYLSARKAVLKNVSYWIENFGVIDYFMIWEYVRAPFDDNEGDGSFVRIQRLVLRFKNKDMAMLFKLSYTIDN